VKKGFHLAAFAILLAWPHAQLLAARSISAPMQSCTALRCFWVSAADASTPILGHGEAGTDTGATHPAWDHLVRWLGHFHPALTVFPIAMLLGAALAEFLRLLGGASWLDGASRWCIIVGAMGGALAAPLGWAFALDHSESLLLRIHGWLGTATAGLGLV